MNNHVIGSINRSQKSTYFIFIIVTLLVPFQESFQGWNIIYNIFVLDNDGVVDDNNNNDYSNIIHPHTFVPYYSNFKPMFEKGTKNIKLGRVNV